MKLTDLIKHEENIMFYNNVGELYSCITKLLDDEKFRLKISNAGFELAKKHTYEQRVKKLIQFYGVII